MYILKFVFLRNHNMLAEKRFKMLINFFEILGVLTWLAYLKKCVLNCQLTVNTFEFTKLNCKP